MARLLTNLNSEIICLISRKKNLRVEGRLELIHQVNNLNKPLDMLKVVVLSLMTHTYTSKIMSFHLQTLLVLLLYGSRSSQALENQNLLLPDFLLTLILIVN